STNRTQSSRLVFFGQFFFLSSSLSHSSYFFLSVFFFPFLHMVLADFISFLFPS
ncbi:hypothetical protein GIB67_002436, partial [Kingdonia uniflora]